MTKVKISLIAALSDNRVIGKDNQIPWHLSEDLKRFKQLTQGHAVIMGRKTYESILSLRGQPLPKRKNIIVTRAPDFFAPNCVVCHSVADAIKQGIAYELTRGEVAKNGRGAEVFIIGGGKIFAETIKYADKLYLTIINRRFDGDAYFPTYDNFKKEV
ncbi:dihydrofolate reductase, partial [Candidatus Roizmanbacteria bacterium]|nr:dihydrofolate reductase [Candidatus Roizmanbacteria bacterium]